MTIQTIIKQIYFKMNNFIINKTFNYKIIRTIINLFIINNKDPKMIMIISNKWVTKVIKNNKIVINIKMKNTYLKILTIIFKILKTITKILRLLPRFKNLITPNSFQ